MDLDQQFVDDTLLELQRLREKQSNFYNADDEGMGDSSTLKRSLSLQHSKRRRNRALFDVGNSLNRINNTDRSSEERSVVKQKYLSDNKLVKSVCNISSKKNCITANVMSRNKIEKENRSEESSFTEEDYAHKSWCDNPSLLNSMKTNSYTTKNAPESLKTGSKYSVENKGTASFEDHYGTITTDPKHSSNFSSKTLKKDSSLRLGSSLQDDCIVNNKLTLVEFKQKNLTIQNCIGLSSDANESTLKHGSSSSMSECFSNKEMYQRQLNNGNNENENKNMGFFKFNVNETPTKSLKAEDPKPLRTFIVTKTPAKKKEDSSNRKMTQQIDSYVTWINTQLERRADSRSVRDLACDMSDGVVFLQLVEVISQTKQKIINHNDMRDFDRLKNINTVVEFLSQNNVRVHHILPREIVEGNLKATMRLVLALAAHFKPEAFNYQGFNTSSRSSSKLSQRTPSLVSLASEAAASLADASKNASKGGTTSIKNKYRRNRHTEPKSSTPKSSTPTELSDFSPLPNRFGRLNNSHGNSESLSPPSRYSRTGRYSLTEFPVDSSEKVTTRTFHTFDSRNMKNVNRASKENNSVNRTSKEKDIENRNVTENGDVNGNSGGNDSIYNKKEKIRRALSENDSVRTPITKGSSVKRTLLPPTVESYDAEFDDMSEIMTMQDDLMEDLGETKNVLGQLQNLLLAGCTPDEIAGIDSPNDESFQEQLVVKNIMLENKESECTDLRNQLNELKEINLRLNSEKTSIELRLSQQEQMILSLKSKLLEHEHPKAPSPKYQELHSLLEERSKELQLLHQELNRRDKLIETQKIEVDSLSHDVVGKKRTEASLHAKLEASECMVSSLQSQLQEATENLHTLSIASHHDNNKQSNNLSTSNRMILTKRKKYKKKMSREHNNVAITLANIRKRFPTDDPAQHAFESIGHSMKEITNLLSLMESGSLNYSSDSGGSSGKSDDNNKDHRPSVPPKPARISKTCQTTKETAKSTISTDSGYDHNANVSLDSGGSNEVKVVYFLGKSVTPILKSSEIWLGYFTLRDFKEVVNRPGKYRYFFKTKDKDFGFVKEELFYDDDVVPGHDNKIVCWMERIIGEEV